MRRKRGGAASELLRHLCTLLMAALVAVETCLLVLISLLVAGLLRSHAEILRVLNLDPDRDTDSTSGDHAFYSPNRPLEDPTMGPAHELAGLSPALEPIDFPLDHEDRGTLIAFLSSGCLTCYEFWKALDGEEASQVPEGIRAVVVTKGPEEESLAKIRELAPKLVPVVMSSEAWKAYDVPGAPYFAWIDAQSQTVQGVGAATQWPSVIRLLEDALAEGNGGRDGPQAADGDEAELVAAGIFPGDPSLNDPVEIKDGGLA